MTDRTESRFRPSHGRKAAVGVVLLALLALAGWLAEREARAVFLRDAARGGETTLRLAVGTLRAELERFERLPALIAEQAVVQRLAEAPDDPGRVTVANAYLEEIAGRLGATDVYFMDPGGTTRAASNHATATSFVGRNFAFRPYFTDAMAQGAGRFFALGTTSLKRGYYFGAPVRTSAGLVGALIFTIDLDAIESTWQGGEGEIIVTDPEGVVFLSSRPEWQFRALDPLTPDMLRRTSETRRYAGVEIEVLPVTRNPEADGLRLDLGAGDWGPARSYVKLTEAMPEAGWDVSVLLPTARAEAQARLVALVTVLTLGLGTMGGAVVLQRRARLRERMEMQQAARDQLERRVRERTAELAALNSRLEDEIAERRAAEADLRQAQAGLVQAGKMAALGQMSAALSHEFNQPLAAARNFADNALVLIDRGRVADARGNVERILALIERMAAISRNLRSFARKPGQKLAGIELAEVVAAAAEIAEFRLRTAGATLNVVLAPGLPRVIGGPVRLQQVLVNLITNAADAVEGAEDRTIDLAAVPVAGGVRLTVSDRGPGVAPGLTERIFDPFFSTKQVGKGLGLGLSISYNIIKDFGGLLSVSDRPGGGAVFTVDLRAAEAETEAA